MNSEAFFIAVVSVALFVSGLSLLAYLPIAILLIVRSNLMKTDITFREFSLSFFIVLGVVASNSFPDGYFIVFYSVAFTIPLGLLIVNSFKLISNEKEHIFRRLFATQGMLGAMFIAIIGGFSFLDFVLSVTVNYLPIIAIMVVVVAMNFVIHVRNANFPRSHVSVLQGAIATFAVIATCWWIIIIDWYGYVLIYFCYSIWVVQLTTGLEKVVSKSKRYGLVVFSMLIIWIIIGGVVSYNTSEPWLS